MQRYDVAVIGLGAMGSAAAYQLAKAGAKIIGLDQFAPPHSYGSTHGDTRITRLAIGEGEEYVALAKRSHELWREIEQESGASLLTQCGGIIIMPEGLKTEHHGAGDFLKRTIVAAEKFGIEHEVLTAEAINERFPQFAVSPGVQGYFEPEAGYLRPEQCVQTQLDLARKYGTELQTGEKVLSYDAKPDEVIIKTTKGEYAANKIVITAGPWINDLVPGYKRLFRIYRQVLYWFDIENANAAELWQNSPVFVWMFGERQEDYVYGFPAVNGERGGIKVATEHYAEETGPDNTDRNVSHSEIKEMYQEHVRGKLSGIKNKCLQAKTCLYTVTPDSKFLIDYHPQHPNVLVASPCSGHGFKHSAAIGEVLAELLNKGKSTIDISEFTFDKRLQ